jgi:hypothetical protein
MADVYYVYVQVMREMFASSDKESVYARYLLKKFNIYRFSSPADLCSYRIGLLVDS